MSKQLEFVKLLFNKLLKDVAIYIINHEKDGRWNSGNYMDKNHGKTALKRKITLLRQELLNLERMLDDE